MDGSDATLIYDFDALETLEEEFGSLSAIQSLVTVDETGAPVGKAFGPIRKLVGAGLLHQGISLEDSKHLLDPARLAEYLSAASAAIEEALPRAGKDEAAAAQNGSTGPASTTPPPSSSGEATQSSGA